jgi:hypothetical protein
MWLVYLLIFTAITAVFPYLAAYDRVRKDLINAATPEAKELANNGYHYYMAFAIWGIFIIPCWVFVLVIVS